MARAAFTIRTDAAAVDRGALAAYMTVFAPNATAAAEVAVATAWDRIDRAHAALALDGVQFFAFARARIGGAAPWLELSRRHVEDLALAFGCAGANPAALAALERDVLPGIERGLAGFAEPREVVQILRERMLVDRDGPAAIAGYDGRAPLSTWLRVCATRIALREAGRAGRATTLEDGRLEQLAPGVPDPELAYLRRLYGAEFRAAFGEAVAQLTPRERNLLRLSVIDGLGIDQIAAIFHIHRSTAARQLRLARDGLVAATRDRMRRALRLSPAELDSVLRMIVSLTDLTLRHVLGHDRARNA